MSCNSSAQPHLDGKKIVIASLQDWNYLLLSKHYIALELAKRNNEIIFISLSRIGTHDNSNKYLESQNFNGIVQKNIRVVKLKVLVGFLKLKLVAIFTKWLVKAQLVNVKSPDYIFIFDPQFSFLADLYSDSMKIYYCVDHIAQSKTLKNVEQKILKKVDMVITASSRLYDEYKKMHRNVYFIPHGVDLLKQYDMEESKVKIDQWFEKYKSKLIFGYVGNIGSQVDLEILDYIAHKNNNYLIVLIGPIAPDIREKASDLADNIKFFGPVPAIAIKYCMVHLNVGLIPYKNNEFNSRRNPIKILQYLAFGMPVVSTEIGISFDNPNLICQSNDKEIFHEHIVKMLKENTDELIQSRKEYSEANSWSSRIDELDKILQQGKIKI